MGKCNDRTFTKNKRLRFESPKTTNNLIFFVPPYFYPETPVREVLLTPFQTSPGTGTAADTTNDSQFQLVRSESLGDYSATYESVTELMDNEILTDKDKATLSKYKRQYFTSAHILD